MKFIKVIKSKFMNSELPYQPKLAQISDHKNFAPHDLWKSTLSSAQTLEPPLAPRPSYNPQFWVYMGPNAHSDSPKSCKKHIKIYQNF